MTGTAAHASTAPLRVVGVAFDGSPAARAALDHAAGIARAAGARLRAITVVDPASLRVMGHAARAKSDADRRAVLEQLAATAADRLGRVLADIPGVPHEAVVRIGDPAQELRRAAGEGVDVLVTGSRGRGPLAATVLGSVSGSLTRSCPVPVLVVPREAAEPAA